MDRVVTALCTAAALLSLTSCAEEATNEEPSASEASGVAREERPFRATNQQVRVLVEDELGDESDNELERVRDVSCDRRRSCVVEYNTDTPVFSPEKELLEATRPIFETLFSDRRLRQATLSIWGETTSVGGKESQSEVMTISCDRAAHREIDWSEVDADGLKTLCVYTPMVSFD